MQGRTARTFTPAQEWYVKINHDYMTAKQMANHLVVPRQVVYNICNLRGWKPKPDPNGTTAGMKFKDEPEDIPVVVKRKKKGAIVRAPAVYSNSGYAELIDKYAPQTNVHMRVLTIKQPWASLLVMGAKVWETRSWAPKKPMQNRLQTEGLLIHASTKFDRADQRRAMENPFSKHIDDVSALPLGKIIGYARLGSVLTTDTWKETYFDSTHPDIDEYAFGDYSSGRFAWQVRDVIAFPPQEQLAIKGMLGLWQYDGPLLTSIPQPVL